MFPCFHTKLSKNSMVLIAYMHSLVTLLKLQTFHCCPKAKVNLLILFVFFFLNNHFCSFHFADSGTNEGICWREEWRSQAVGASVSFTDRTGQTAGVRYRYTGPVWPETGRNRSNSNLNSKTAVQSVRTGLAVGLTGNRPNSIFFSFLI